MHARGAGGGRREHAFIHSGVGSGVGSLGGSLGGIAGGLEMYQRWGGTPSGGLLGSLNVPNRVWYISYPTPFGTLLKGG